MAEGRFSNPVVAALAGFYDLFRKQELQDRLQDADHFRGKTVMITGANSGLGFALSVEVAKRGGHLIMACRRHLPEVLQEVKRQSGSDKVEMRYLDLGDLSTIHTFVETLQSEGITLDVTYFNAASAAPKTRITASGLDELFQVNYFANFVLVNALLYHRVIQPDHKQQPRLIFISSNSHRDSSAIDYEEFGKYFEYGISKAISNYSYFKLVLNTFATELSRRLNRHQVVAQVHAVCPGPVNTNIIKEAPQPIQGILRGIFTIIFRSPKKAAQPAIYLGCSADFANTTNQYLHTFIAKQMDGKVYDEEEGKKLWEESAKLWEQVDPKAFDETVMPTSA